MSKIKIRPRVIVYEHASDRVPFYACRQVTERMLRLGQASVEMRDKFHCISAVRLTLAPVEDLSLLGARPGSYGIVREHLATGAVVFAHHNPYDVLAVAN